MPKLDPPVERRSLTPDEGRALLKAAAGERLEARVVVGPTVGLRPGELGGLLWSDLDLDATPPTLTVSGSMKRTPEGLTRGAVKRSTAGERTVALPAVAVEALRAHRGRQAKEQMAARYTGPDGKVGSMWRDHGLVFSSRIGTPLNPPNVRRTSARIASPAGLDARFPYLLRHTAVSLLIDDGASIEEVADLLGDDPRTLYRHYRHKVRPVAEAATRMQAVLGATAD
jgi:integrase